MVVTSGRADASPLRKVVEELRKRCAVYELGLGGRNPSECVDDVTYFLHDTCPDILLLLGDRYETLATALAATYCRVPIAHIHGGETTLGAFDNNIRDAVTKLSHLHFVATDYFAEVLVQFLGEDHSRVWRTGAPGLDLIPRDKVKRGNHIVVTYHPETLGDDASLVPMLEALNRVYDRHIIWTGVNQDPGAIEVESAFVSAGYTRRALTPDEYIECCRTAALIVGNSSSGIIEAPSMGVPSVNVGIRQKGRISGPSVNHVTVPTDAIEASIIYALDYGGPFTNPYQGENASEQIAEIVATHDLDGIMVKA